MKSKKLIGTGVLVLAAAGAGAWGASAAFEPEDDHPGKRYVAEFKAKATNPDMMAAYMKAGEPGVAHELIALFAGEFNATTRMWMNPSQPPMESKAKSVNTMIMGGRFLETEFTGDMMGFPFTGKGLMGYDNNRGLFVNMWIDSMTTGFGIAKGNLDESGTAITFIGEMDEPTTGELGKAYKQVFRLIDEDTHVLEMWEILYGDEFKVMEIVYERVEG